MASEKPEQMTSLKCHQRSLEPFLLGRGTHSVRRPGACHGPAASGLRDSQRSMIDHQLEDIGNKFPEEPTV